jgi:hypothetical protein
LSDDARRLSGKTCNIQTNSLAIQFSIPCPLNSDRDMT